MSKLCDISIRNPLEIIFWNCSRSGKFSSEWKKSNVISTLKKVANYIENYRQVSLLPVCGKVFELLLHQQNIFIFFQKTTLYSQVNMDLDQVILVATSHYQLHTKFFQYLMMFMKSGASFLIYLKHSIEFGMKACFLSYSKMRYALLK